MLTEARLCRQELSWRLSQPCFVERSNVDRSYILSTGTMFCRQEQSGRREAAREVACEAAKAAWDVAKAAWEAARAALETAKTAWEAVRAALETARAGLGDGLGSGQGSLRSLGPCPEARQA